MNRGPGIRLSSPVPRSSNNCADCGEYWLVVGSQIRVPHHRLIAGSNRGGVTVDAAMLLSSAFCIVFLQFDSGVLGDLQHPLKGYQCGRGRMQSVAISGRIEVVLGSAPREGGLVDVEKCLDRLFDRFVARFDSGAAFEGPTF